MLQSAQTSSDLSPQSLLQSSLLLDLGVKHGFFTRVGGVSQGVFASLSFAQNSGDSPEAVNENLRRVGRCMDVRGNNIYFLSQVHGVDYHIAHAKQDQAEVNRKQGDIVLSCDPHAAAAIRTADCVPILFASRTSPWVAACHSGWQGCVRGAAAAAVRALFDQGARNLVAAIGPHISPLAFEVGPDVAEQLINASPDPDIVDRSRDQPHINLRKMVRSQLLAAGLAQHDIDDVDGCTVLEPERFFSFRRDKNPSGRMLSVIVPPQSNSIS